MVLKLQSVKMLLCSGKLLYLNTVQKQFVLMPTGRDLLHFKVIARMGFEVCTCSGHNFMEE